MEGRIIAIRVSDADFELLDGLKRKEGIGWNQLLLVPVEVAYGVTLESARPKGKVKETSVCAAAEVIVADEPPKKGKGKKAGSKPTPEAVFESTAEKLAEDEVAAERLETETGD